MKRCTVIRHVVYEGIAGFREPIEAAGYEVERIAACETDWTAIDLVAPDLLVVMGGPMGVYETTAHPWITSEVAAIAQRIAADRPTLGVCLGSQIIAAAMGAAVFAGDRREVGFAPIALSEAGKASPLRHLADVAVLHWHGDTFDLPAGTERLASSQVYPHQAFRRGARLLALQFHVEMGEDPRIEAWIAEGADYLAGAGIDPHALRIEHDRLGSAAVRAGQAMMAEWLAGLAP